VLTLAQSYNLFSIARTLRNSRKQEILRFYAARIEPRMREKREVDQIVPKDEPEWFQRYEAEEKKKKENKNNEKKVNRRHKELPEPELVLKHAKLISRPASLTKPGLATAVRWNLDLFHFYHITKLEKWGKPNKYFTNACMNAIQWFLDESAPPATLHALYRDIHREVISRYLTRGQKTQEDLQWFFDFLVSHPCGDIALMMDLEEAALQLGFSLGKDSVWHEVLAKACRHNYPDSATLLRGLSFVKTVPDWLFDCFCRQFAKSDPDSVRELLSWKRDQSRLRVDDLLHFQGEHMAQACRRFYPHCIDRGNEVALQKLRWKLVFEASSNPNLTLDDLLLLMQPDVFETHTSTWTIDPSLAPYLNQALTRLCESNANPELAKEVMELMLSYGIPFTETSVKRAVPFSLQSISKSVNMWADIAQSGPIESRQQNYFELHKKLSPKQKEAIPETYFIPSAFAGRVLGEAGKTMASIREKSGARISIMPHEEGQSMRKIRISGKREQREQALALLETCTVLKPEESPTIARADTSRRIECITEGFLASQITPHTFEWLEFVKNNFKVDRKKLCQRVIRGKIERSTKFGILESLYTYESIFGAVPNAIVDKAMQMCATKGYTALALDMFETLQRPGRSFTKEFYADLIFTLLKDGKEEEAAHCLKRSGDLAIDSLSVLQEKLRTSGKLTFSDRQLLTSFDALRESHLLSNSENWQQFAERNLIRFQDRLKLNLDFDVISDRNVNIRKQLSRICEDLKISFENHIPGRCVRIWVKDSEQMRNLQYFLRTHKVKAMSYPRLRAKGFFLFLKTAHDVDIVPNGITYDMKFIEMTEEASQGELMMVDVSNDWLPKQVQVERVFINWMAENDIVAVLNSLKDSRWMNFLHSKKITIPLARFLANHGQFQYAIELLDSANPPMSISPTTLITLTQTISTLDFACLSESENTRKRKPIPLDSVFSNCVMFLDRFRLSVTPELKRHLESICLECGYFSLKEGLAKHGYFLLDSKLTRSKSRRNAAEKQPSSRFLEAA